MVDPINQSRGFFQWRDGGLVQVGGYFLTADRGDRIALARLVNDLEKLPNPEGGGGGMISPRLEAELIKMLTRPAHFPVTSPAEKVQIATVFGMLGTFLGVLAVALAMWLYQLQARIQDQNESFLALARAVEQLGDNQRLAIDTLIQKVGGDKPDEFLERYNKTAREPRRGPATAQDPAVDHRATGRPGQGPREAADRSRRPSSHRRRRTSKKYETDAEGGTQAPQARSPASRNRTIRSSIGSTSWPP